MKMENSKVEVNLLLNGMDVRRQVPGDMSLLRFLRDEMGLMGAKDGCSTGHCGACMVIIDSKATRACLVKMARLDHKRIETIEG